MAKTPIAPAAQTTTRPDSAMRGPKTSYVDRTDRKAAVGINNPRGCARATTSATTQTLFLIEADLASRRGLLMPQQRPQLPAKTNRQGRPALAALLSSLYELGQVLKLLRR